MVMSKYIRRYMSRITSKLIKYLVLGLVPLLMAVANTQAFAANKITFYHYDLLGSPVATTNELGEVVWREEYSPYGEKLLNQDAALDKSQNDNVIGYTGHVFDEETGLTYMQARYYDAEIGRFMGVDPVGFMSDNTISFNRYAYAGDNPYKYTDPNGEFFVLAALATPTGIALTVATVAALAQGIRDTIEAINAYNESKEGEEESESSDVRGNNVRPTSEPVDLEEDLASQEVLGELGQGLGDDSMTGRMKDPRYGADGDYDKVRGSHLHPDGTVTEIHADRNRKTGELTDTKFKDAPDNNKSRANQTDSSNEQNGQI